jgi:hypothetical protein
MALLAATDSGAGVGGMSATGESRSRTDGGGGVGAGSRPVGTSRSRIGGGGVSGAISAVGTSRSRTDGGGGVGTAISGMGESRSRMGVSPVGRWLRGGGGMLGAGRVPSRTAPARLGELEGLEGLMGGSLETMACWVPPAATNQGPKRRVDGTQGRASSRIRPLRAVEWEISKKKGGCDAGRAVFPQRR